MKFLVDKPQFILVTGLARTGTTLLCSLIHSAENAVCLSEPHNELQHKGFVTTGDKLPGTVRADITDPKQIVDWVRGATDFGQPYDLTGVKEVYEQTLRDDRIYLLDYAISASDRILVTVRCPVATWRSVHARLHHPLGDFINRMVSFARFCERYQAILTKVCFEDLVTRPQQTLGKALPFEGDFVKRRTIGFGDLQAHRSDEVYSALNHYPMVDRADEQAIRRVMWDYELYRPYALQERGIKYL